MARIVIAGIELTPAHQALLNRYMSTPMPHHIYGDHDPAERVLMKLDQWREHIRQEETHRHETSRN